MKTFCYYLADPGNAEGHTPFIGDPPLDFIALPAAEFRVSDFWPSINAADNLSTIIFYFLH